MVRPRPVNPTKERDELLSFIRTMADFWDMRLPGLIKMRASLEGVLKRGGRRIPIAGLRDAAHDMVLRSTYVSSDVVREADVYLEERGVPTLTTMIGRVEDVVTRVISTGRIATDGEFHMVKDLLADANSMRVVDLDTRTVERLLYEYEQRPRKASREG